jgi:hypothetical protein
MEIFGLIDERYKHMHKEVYKYGLIIQVREVIWKMFGGKQEFQDKWIEEFLMRSLRTSFDNDDSFMKIYGIMARWKGVCISKGSENPCKCFGAE